MLRRWYDCGGVSSVLEKNTEFTEETLRLKLLCVTVALVCVTVSLVCVCDYSLFSHMVPGGSVLQPLWCEDFTRFLCFINGNWMLKCLFQAYKMRCRDL